MTGNTRAIAEELRAALRADGEEFVEPRTRRGWFGALRALIDNLTGRLPEIVPTRYKARDYDLVVLGGPIWAGRMAAPVRSFAARFGKEVARVAFFCTEGGSGAQSAFAQLQRHFAAPAVATLAIDAKHLAREAHQHQLQQFVAALKASLAVH